MLTVVPRADIPGAAVTGGKRSLRPHAPVKRKAGSIASHMQSHHAPTSTRDWLPVASLILAATLWGLVWYPLRLLENNGLAGLWAALLIYAATLVVSVPVLAKTYHQLVRHPGVLLAIALASGWCNVSFFLALLEGNVVRVVLLFYLSPVWTVILGRLILGERVTGRNLFNLIVAMGGAMVMLWQPEMGWPWPQDGADWLAISSGMGFALTNVFVRMARGVSVELKAVAAWWGGALIALVWIILAGVPFPVVTGATVSGALALGLFGMVVMTWSVQYGVTHMPVQRSAVILLFELVVAAVSSQLLTDEMIRPLEWVGGGLILIAAWRMAKQGAH